MSMSRKNYEAMADGLHEAMPVPDPYQEEDIYLARMAAWRHSVEAVAKVFAEDNPRFDYARFYTRVGHV